MFLELCKPFESKAQIRYARKPWNALNEADTEMINDFPKPKFLADNRPERTSSKLRKPDFPHCYESSLKARHAWINFSVQVNK